MKDTLGGNRCQTIVKNVGFMRKEIAQSEERELLQHASLVTGFLSIVRETLSLLNTARIVGSIRQENALNVI